MEAGDEVDAGGDHGGGVDEGAHGRRAGHGVGQPGLEGELRGLADGAGQDQEGDDGQRGAEAAEVSQRGLEVQRAEAGEEQEEADQQGRVADAASSGRPCGPARPLARSRYQKPMSR